MALAACADSSQAISSRYTATVACSGSFISSTDHYKLMCPVGWTVTTSSNAPDELLIAARNQMAGMVISSPVGRITASQYGAILQSRVMAAGATNITITPMTAPATFGSHPWTVTAAGTCTRGTTNFVMQQYATFQNGERYLAVLYAPTTSPALVDNVLVSMLASMTFQ